MSSTKRDSLTSSFLISTPLISFSCLIALASVSSTMLKKSGNKGQPCQFPAFKGNSSNLFTFRMMWVFLMWVCMQFASILPRIFASMFINEMDLYLSFLLLSLPGFGIRVMLAS